MFVRLEPEQPPANHSWHKLQEMLAAYNAATSHPLTSQEIQALPIQMARVPLYWIAEAHVYPNPAQIVVHLADSVTFSRWLLQHSNEIVEGIYG
jgi:hypothetical protein